MKKKRLLVYYPSNKKANSIKAQIELLAGFDLDVYVLTQDPEGVFHEDLKDNKKIKVFAGQKHSLRGIGFYPAHAKMLTAFCKKHDIDIVCSHLQVANLVSLLSSAMLPKVDFYFFRHHFQYFKKFRFDYLKPNRNELIGEKLISRFARKIIVPSSSVREGMIQYENVPGSKVWLIPYVYNFEEYDQPDPEKVETIITEYPFSLRLLMCSRFIEGKRHRLVFDVVKSLICEEGLDIGLLLLDNGPLKRDLEAWVQENGLKDRIFFKGYVDNIMDYFAASDLLVHPSLTEASNSSVKEMALAGRTSVVCSGVGDFDDYITDRETGFLIDPMNSEEELKSIIRYTYQHKEKVHQMGWVLKREVIQRFSVNPESIRLYKELLKLV